MRTTDRQGNVWFGAEHQCPACFPPVSEDGYHCHECGRLFPTLAEFDAHRHPGGLAQLQAVTGL